MLDQRLDKQKSIFGECTMFAGKALQSIHAWESVVLSWSTPENMRRWPNVGWPTIYNVGLTVNQRWANVSCLLRRLGLFMLWGLHLAKTFQIGLHCPARPKCSIYINPQFAKRVDRSNCLLALRLRSSLQLHIIGLMSCVMAFQRQIKQQARHWRRGKGYSGTSSAPPPRH